MEPGYIDLHCHPLPGIDDGVKTPEDGVALLRGLRSVGFSRVVATPHVRSGVYDNRRDTVDAARAVLEPLMAHDPEGLPALDLAAEHMLDDVFWELFSSGRALLYPGGRAALVEFPYDAIPYRVEVRLWRMTTRKVAPVLAHPERYGPLFRSSDALEPVLGAGTRLLLDVMSLVGAYGREPQHAAERMLDEGLYFAACSDAHKPGDAARVGEAIAVLGRRVGEAGVTRLLREGPRTILDEATV